MAQDTSFVGSSNDLEMSVTSGPAYVTGGDTFYVTLSESAGLVCSDVFVFDDKDNSAIDHFRVSGSNVVTIKTKESYVGPTASIKVLFACGDRTVSHVVNVKSANIKEIQPFFVTGSGKYVNLPEVNETFFIKTYALLENGGFADITAACSYSVDGLEVDQAVGVTLSDTNKHRLDVSLVGVDSGDIEKSFNLYAVYSLKKVSISRYSGLGFVTPEEYRIPLGGAEVAQFSLRFGGSAVSASKDDEVVSLREDVFTLPAGSDSETSYELVGQTVFHYGDSLDSKSSLLLGSTSDIQKACSRAAVFKGTVDCIRPSRVSLLLSIADFNRYTRTARDVTKKQYYTEDASSCESEVGSHIKIDVVFGQDIVSAKGYSDFWVSKLNLYGGSLPADCLIGYPAGFSEEDIEGIQAFSIVKNADIFDSNISGCSLKSCRVSRSKITGAPITGSSVTSRKDVALFAGADNVYVDCVLSDIDDIDSFKYGCAFQSCVFKGCEIKNSEGTLFHGCSLVQSYVYDCTCDKNFGIDTVFEGCVLDRNTSAIKVFVCTDMLKEAVGGLRVVTKTYLGRLGPSISHVSDSLVIRSGINENRYDPFTFYGTTRAWYEYTDTNLFKTVGVSFNNIDGTNNAIAENGNIDSIERLEAAEEANVDAKKLRNAVFSERITRAALSAVYKTYNDIPSSFVLNDRSVNELNLVQASHCFELEQVGLDEIARVHRKVDTGYADSVGAGVSLSLWPLYGTACYAASVGSTNMIKEGKYRVRYADELAENSLSVFDEIFADIGSSISTKTDIDGSNASRLTGKQLLGWSFKPCKVGGPGSVDIGAGDSVVLSYPGEITLFPVFDAYDLIQADEQDHYQTREITLTPTARSGSVLFDLDDSQYDSTSTFDLRKAYKTLRIEYDAEIEFNDIVGKDTKPISAVSVFGKTFLSTVGYLQKAKCVFSDVYLGNEKSVFNVRYLAGGGHTANVKVVARLVGREIHPRVVYYS